MKYYPAKESLGLLFEEERLYLITEMINYARKDPHYDSEVLYQAQSDLFKHGRLSASTYNYLLNEYESYSMWELIDVR